MDVTIAVSSLLLLSPPLLIVALAIKIESPGPVFFAYRRVGKDGKEFYALKFRSMRLDAEEKLSELLRANPSALAEWVTTRKLKNDPRITIVGKFLRKSSIDELPQLVNILRGEMSVVGPRAMPSDYPTDEETQKLLKLRQRMRPGLTGLGQLSQADDDRRERGRLLSDMLYVLEHSIALDIGILLKTVLHVFREPGENKAAGIFAIFALMIPAGIIVAMLIATIAV
nr:sugar transferase [Rhizobium leguminosarum]